MDEYGAAPVPWGTMNDQGQLLISKPSRPLTPAVVKKLEKGLGACPDVAFAHLPQVALAESESEANLVLFVWLKGEAMRSLRSALNLVSEIVAKALPKDEFVDVVILNSAPELLLSIEETGCLVVDNDPQERARALERAQDPEGLPAAMTPRRKWWWPF